MTLRDAITRGIYRTGDVLPSSRDLAERFGVNRNTVNMIYRELEAEGLLEKRRNAPPVVAATIAPQPDFVFGTRIRDALRSILHEGLLSGLSEAETRHAVEEAIDSFFRSYRPPSVFVCECNRADAKSYALQLSTALGLAVRPILLDQISTGIEAGVVAVPLFHLAEVRRALGKQSDRVEAILVTPTMEDIAQLISRTTHGPVAVVAGNPAAVERLSGFLRFHLQIPFLPATFDDAARIAQVVREAEIVACTVRCQGSVHRAGGREKTVTIRYHVDPLSVGLVRARLAGSRTNHQV